MIKNLDLFAIYITKQISTKYVEEALGITLKKGIEATLYAELNHSMITLTHFNVLTLINWPKEKIPEILKLFEIDYPANILTSTSIYQDYPIIIDPDLNTSFTIDNDKIRLQEYNILNLLIISHVISQSIALEVYENKLSNYYEKSRDLIDTSDTYSIFKRAQLTKFAKQLVLIRHDMLIELYLLDKPNILWDNEDAEMLYIKLAYSLELKDRFDIVEYKLNSIKDDIVMVMDLTNHNHSSFLEWIIIILIMIEIVMGLMEWYGLK